MDGQSLTRALAQLHPAAYGWAVTCCRGDRSLAEDVLQATYVRVLSGEARYSEASTLRTWLFGVVRNISREVLRRRLRDQLNLAALSAARRGREQDDAERETADDAAARVREMLNRLSARQREVLHLVFYDGMRVEDAAEVMGISVGAARQHYERGKRRMRARLEAATMSEGEERDHAHARRRLAAGLL